MAIPLQQQMPDVAAKIQLSSQEYDTVVRITDINALQEEGWKVSLQYPIPVQDAVTAFAKLNVPEGQRLATNHVYTIEEIMIRQKIKRTNLPIVAVQGYFKRGKTYTLNKIWNSGDPKESIKFNHGIEIETIGASMKLPPTRGTEIPMPIIDTAGTDRPLDGKFLQQKKKNTHPKIFLNIQSLLETNHSP